LSEDFHERIARIKASNPIAQVARRLNLVQSGQRYFCPSCQAAGPSQHKSPDLALHQDGFKCWKCGEGGDGIALVRLALACSFLEALTWFDGGESRVRNSNLNVRLSSTTTNNNIGYPLRPTETGVSSIFHGGPRPIYTPTLERNLGPVFQAFQNALPGSLGERYFKSRGFTLEQCQRFGLGYAGPGTWPHGNRDWKHGRVVFPSFSSDSELLNLYGRACEDRVTSVPSI